MTFAEFRECVAVAGGLLLLAVSGAMLVSGLRESARRRRMGWAGHLSGGVSARSARASTSRSYANLAHEHHEHGDEDPPLYSASAAASDEDEARPAARARSRVRLSAKAGLDLVRAQLAVTPTNDTARRARLLGEQARLLAITVRCARAGPGDGRRLSRKESADLMRAVFGDESPGC